MADYFYLAAQYSEINEKSISRFLVFEIWSFKILRIVCIFLSELSKGVQYSIVYIDASRNVN